MPSHPKGCYEPSARRSTLQSMPTCKPKKRTKLTAIYRSPFTVPQAYQSSFCTYSITNEDHRSTAATAATAATATTSTAADDNAGQQSANLASQTSADKNDTHKPLLLYREYFVDPRSPLIQWACRSGAKPPQKECPAQKEAREKARPCTPLPPYNQRSCQPRQRLYSQQQSQKDCRDPTCKRQLPLCQRLPACKEHLSPWCQKQPCNKYQPKCSSTNEYSCQYPEPNLGLMCENQYHHDNFCPFKSREIQRKYICLKECSCQTQKQYPPSKEFGCQIEDHGFCCEDEYKHSVNCPYRSRNNQIRTLCDTKPFCFNLVGVQTQTSSDNVSCKCAKNSWNFLKSYSKKNKKTDKCTCGVVPRLKNSVVLCQPIHTATNPCKSVSVECLPKQDAVCCMKSVSFCDTRRLDNALKSRCPSCISCSSEESSNSNNVKHGDKHDDKHDKHNKSKKVHCGCSKSTGKNKEASSIPENASDRKSSKDKKDKKGLKASSSESKPPNEGCCGNKNSPPSPAPQSASQQEKVTCGCQSSKQNSDKKDSSHRVAETADSPTTCPMHAIKHNCCSHIQTFYCSNGSNNQNQKQPKHSSCYQVKEIVPYSTYTYSQEKCFMGPLRDNNRSTHISKNSCLVGIDNWKSIKEISSKIQEMGLSRDLYDSMQSLRPKTKTIGILLNKSISINDLRHHKNNCFSPKSRRFYMIKNHYMKNVKNNKEDKISSEAEISSCSSISTIKSIVSDKPDNYIFSCPPQTRDNHSNLHLQMSHNIDNNEHAASSGSSISTCNNFEIGGVASLRETIYKDFLSRCCSPMPTCSNIINSHNYFNINKNKRITNEEFVYTFRSSKSDGEKSELKELQKKEAELKAFEREQKKQVEAEKKVSEKEIRKKAQAEKKASMKDLKKQETDKKASEKEIKKKAKEEEKTSFKDLKKEGPEKKAPLKSKDSKEYKSAKANSEDSTQKTCSCKSPECGKMDKSTATGSSMTGVEEPEKCDCCYPPAFSQFPCTGTLLGNCSCVNH